MSYDSRVGARLTRDLAMLLRLGYSVPEALARASVRDSRLKKLEAATRSGATLGAALRAEPGLLPEHCAEALDSASEALPEALAQLAAVLERSASRERSIRMVLAYPRFLVTALMFLTLILSLGLVDVTRLFTGLRLPLPTQLLLFITGKLPLAVLLAAGLGVVLLLSGSGPLVRARLHLPILGSWIRRNQTATWLEWLDLLLAQGQPLPLAARGAAQACSDEAFHEHMESVAAKLERGDSLSAAAKSTGLLSPLAEWMLARAEVTGFPPLALSLAAATLQRELDVEDGRHFALLEWLGLIAVGFIVGIVVLGYFLPLYQLIGNLG